MSTTLKITATFTDAIGALHRGELVNSSTVIDGVAHVHFTDNEQNNVAVVNFVRGELRMHSVPLPNLRTLRLTEA